MLSAKFACASKSAKLIMHCLSEISTQTYVALERINGSKTKVNLNHRRLPSVWSACATHSPSSRAECNDTWLEKDYYSCKKLHNAQNQ